MFAYEKLDVWQLAKKLVVAIYKVTKIFPSDERFGLTSQLNRAAVSVASNIAEGTSRNSYKHQAHFTQLSYGSLMEVACQLELAAELGFIQHDIWNSLKEEIEVLASKFSALRNSQLKRVNSQR